MALFLSAAFALAQAQSRPPQGGELSPDVKLKTRTAGAAPVVMAGPDGRVDPRLAAAGSRIAEAAERFSQAAQQYMCRETLVQRAIRTRSVRKVKGTAVALGSNPQYDHRQIVSFYGFTTVGRSPAIRELRQVLTVDKETLAKEFEGRKSFRNALLAHDDESKGGMMSAFGAEGLRGVATDLGQMVLLFDRDSMKNFAFEYDREERIGSTSTMVIRYTQKRGSEAVRIDENGKHSKGELRGWLWVRLPDHLPVRITMITTRNEKKRDVRDEAEVDYAEISSGALLPMAVIHRRWENDILAAEDDFRYSEWQPLQ
jgi:hypothetical protein